MRSQNGQDQKPPEGKAKLGIVSSSEAAIWFSTVADFTRLSERLTPAQLIDSLNQYFGAVAGAIHANRGEVVSYIGDAILAVFPVAKFHDLSAETCGAALAALNASSDQLARVNGEREERGESPFRHWVGLHFGGVNYANIGCKEHSAFTVIGQDVNITCRVGGMCSQVEQSVLASATFATLSRTPMKNLGPFSLKGIAAPMCLFAPTS